MRDYMRKRRQHSETKEKDRESTFKSMNKVRQSKDFQEKELAAKRISRQKPETKDKDRESTLKSMNKARQRRDFSMKEGEAKKLKRANIEQVEKERIAKRESRCKKKEIVKGKLIEYVKLRKGHVHSLENMNRY